MNKTELIDAIQQVITPNGKKAISAESLANLLIEMVNATPEGGNGGSGQVVFYMGMPNEEFTEVTLTPEEKAHNVEMFKVVKESPIALSTSVDMTRYYAFAMQEDLGHNTEGMKYNITAYATIYITEGYSQSLGLDSELVAVADEFGVLPDGSIILLPQSSSL